MTTDGANLERLQELTAQVALLPEKPGVYMMRDAAGKIIYVGKAVNLRNRVRSYFQQRGLSPKTEALVARIITFETIVTASEMEALIFECNLIKKHRPRYNISLRDDKSYPFVKVTWNEEYPRVYATRRVEKDGAKYYGPYASAGAMHETLALLKRLFPLRSCRSMDARRPCLEFHINRCMAPCAGLVDAATYREMVKTVCLFLEGRSADVEKDLKRRMLAASDELKFELAGRLRDQLAAVRNVTEKQNIVTGAGDQDVLGLARMGGQSCVQVFFVRSGKLVGRDRFMLSGGEAEVDGEILAAFVKQYYNESSFIPREILTPAALPETDLLTAWLTQRKAGAVHLLTPQRGTKRELVLLAGENATEALRQRSERDEAREGKRSAAVQELAERLGLDSLPQRIECFDISHIQGAETVASMVVFTGGEPDKSEYRRFKLRTVEGSPDDFASMQEVTLRRYREAKEPLPDLIVIDGGKGQLSSALEVIRGVGLVEIPVIGLAKEFEHIFRENISEPLVLPRHSDALRLVQQIRDEAHRFAVGYHRKLRAKRNLVSVLDHIKGIGAKRRQTLWKHFGTIGRIRAASEEELASAPGMNITAAQAVFQFFRQQGK
ncbi:MAG: excinuclease ABC subunit UvrC [Negativicutes bacterium]